MSVDAIEQTVAVVSVESSTQCEDETTKPRMPKLPANQVPSVGTKMSR